MIKNITTGKILSKEKKSCKTVYSQSMGLMFSKKKKDFGLIFEFKKERNIDFHMFFVFYPIDIIFLNSKKEVISLKKNFKPFSVYFEKKKISYAIELPNGTIKRTNTVIGNTVNF